MKLFFKIIPSICLALAVINASALPNIAIQPTGKSVSLGATVKFQLAASGIAPLTYKWRQGDNEIAGAIANSLSLTNIQLFNAGDYVAVVTDASGSVTSKVATLQVDATFTKITAGSIVNDAGTSGASTACAWGDYNNDGWLDLFVNNYNKKNVLYRNKRDGTFEQIAAGHMVLNTDAHLAGVWGDYDNDGHLDLLLVNGGALDGNQRNYLYHNDGDGTFSQPSIASTGAILSDAGGFYGAAWGDYDADGFLDVFVTNCTGNNYLYGNVGGTNFQRFRTLESFSHQVAWVDYDNDGDLDLFIMQFSRAGSIHLYRNDGSGILTRLTTNPFVESVNPAGACWGDFDNDGDFDLFVSNFPSGNDLFHKNRGDGTFEKITQSPLVSESADTSGAAWADYDNDGFLDLFVTAGFFGNGGLGNYLFHNKGDYTFEKIVAGSLVNDQGHSYACAWGDYDNDGFLDLFVANAPVFEEAAAENNVLYRNNANTNSWIKIRCVGTVSNRRGIGAKVRVKAKYAGQDRWQLRQITSSDGRVGGSLEANFGLGDATIIDTIRIEWPSGIVQELHGEAVKQQLTVTEPARLEVSSSGAFKIQSWKGMAFDIQTSTNLTQWLPFSAVTNLTGSAEFTNLDVAADSQRFYRTLLRK